MLTQGLPCTEVFDYYHVGEKYVRLEWLTKSTMSSIKCAKCGLVNFASAPECKRCHAKLHRPVPATDNDPTSVREPVAARGPITVKAPVTDTSSTRSSPRSVTDTSSLIGAAPLEPAVEAEQKKPLAPLPDYFVNEPAPFTVWVNLFAICLAITVLAVGYQFKLFFDFIDSSTWHSMTSPQSRGYFYTPALEPLFYLEVLVKILVFAAALTLLIFLRRKSWLFLKWVRVYLVAGLVYQVLETVGLRVLRASLPGKSVGKPFSILLEQGFWRWYALLAFVAAFVTLLWLGYFSTSKRVRKIFID